MSTLKIRWGWLKLLAPAGKVERLCYLLVYIQSVTFHVVPILNKESHRIFETVIRSKHERRARFRDLNLFGVVVSIEIRTRGERGG
ncbi:hypothetical protein QE152_g7545 [Popillia japonica]|uniref:Secreted protein n=1 Tax=Popillia japonica TaxID=7064 RepID=A0AAW1MD92_POPJA